MADLKAAETTPDSEKNDIAEEVKSDTEAKEEKTPDTPVTEPMTNGSSTPETPKEEALVTDEPIIDNKLVESTESPKVDVEPEQLPVNGLSLEEPKVDSTEPAECETSKPEEKPVEKPEIVPATEITVKKEVCVEQMPLIEPTPPPLPANPPPSSVVSFAATTMAPELTDASLANTAEITANTAPIETPQAEPETVVEPAITSDGQDTEPKAEEVDSEPVETTASDTTDVPQAKEESTESESQEVVVVTKDTVDDTMKEVPDTSEAQDDPPVETLEVKSPEIVVDEVESEREVNEVENNDADEQISEEKAENAPVSYESPESEIPSPEIEVTETNVDSQHSDTKDAQHEDMTKDKTEIETVECNGTHADVMMNGDKDIEEHPRHEAQQDPIVATDKIAELIPEMPTVPELNTDLETSTDVAVAN
ncbi:hypothetical protein KGM_208545 [Danaus plexippus plexippus]|uniref:Uncharacterized protein n=1 Tax=Danaus plexippus plexippus TaxID=278856 RepID=A0A212F3H5_DANPL|nr:hypothetical protein KGM_208545 [Danaus plexippus plexippus]